MELNKYIVVKFSELYLKGGNKKEFLYTLIRNIKTKLSASKIEFKLKNKFDRLEIISNKLEDVFNELKYVVGLSSYYYCFEFETSKENIEKIIYSELSNFSEKTKFRVSSKIIGENNFFQKKKI